MSEHRPKTHKEKQLFEAFGLAIEDERAAQARYGKMAAMAEDPQIREVFDQLQREEVEHEQKLLRMYRDFKARFIPK